MLKLGTHLILNANRCVSFNIFQELGYAANHPTLYIIRASFVFRSDRHRDTSGETSDERERGQTEDRGERRPPDLHDTLLSLNPICVGPHDPSPLLIVTIPAIFHTAPQRLRR